MITLSPNRKTLLCPIVPTIGTLVTQGSFANGTIFDVIVPLPNCNSIPLKNLYRDFILSHYKLNLCSIYKGPKSYKREFIIKMDELDFADFDQSNDEI